MSDSIKHECGLALLRLKKPLEYYEEHYGSWRWGLQAMYLLMEKQHNRGQDGAGLASVKLNLPPGFRYMDRARSNSSTPIKDVFEEVNAPMRALTAPQLDDVPWVKANVPFAAEVYMGHLRYGTYGNGSIDQVHPQIRANNWKARTLALAGNFNLTNTQQLFDLLIQLGQHPKDRSDSVTVLEKLGHFLDRANEILFRHYKDAGMANIEISQQIAEHLDVIALLTEATKDFDGGYVLGGLIGHGDAFVCRDPWGIRPAFYYDSEEITVVTSERPPIQTVFNVPFEQVHELWPGEAIVIKRNGEVIVDQVRKPERRTSCSFERIYFSRGTDSQIYRERHMLGRLLTPSILKAIDEDLDNTVFSFIPNTAETAFYGMVDGLEDWLTERKIATILAQRPSAPEVVRAILAHKIRVEKVAVKDVKLRTFIAQDAQRNDMVPHVYDITYGTVRPHEDNLVIIDDSIVRGTTLRESILRILDRLQPKCIVVVSSAPQLRYPDCYGIDMARLEDLCAFQAAIRLLKERGQEQLIQETYMACKQQNARSEIQVENAMKAIYAPFTAEEISNELAVLLKHPTLQAEVKIIFQSVSNLHKACPHDLGDWYFTGDYPTPSGNRVANRAFINYVEGRKERAY